MANIRTIKRDFFTSEDIVSLSPLARLLFIGLWMEADREGRLEWRPMAFKLRLLPGDNCEINQLLEEMVSRGMVVLYEVLGKKYGFIPTFKEHQHCNLKEPESVIPPPPELCKTCNAYACTCKHVPSHESTCKHVQARVEVEVEVNKNNTHNSAQARADGRQIKTPCPASPDAILTADLRAEAKAKGWPDPDREFPRFRDHYLAKGAQKENWLAAFRLWLQDEITRRQTSPPAAATKRRSEPDDDSWAGAL
ncbi:MAG: hypothetical protein HQL56_01065 [Magnetococcales bacterium]|nr:hypothetical protein [Magnetococcales bacterium]